jgi:hypothetical protein
MVRLMRGTFQVLKSGRAQLPTSDLQTAGELSPRVLVRFDKDLLGGHIRGAYYLSVAQSLLFGDFNQLL